jgi:hypothetical protein
VHRWQNHLTPPLILTFAFAGKYGLVLADPDSSAELARCDFRNGTGITINSIEFVSIDSLGPLPRSGLLETVTRCMRIKDSFGVSHTILLPSHDISCDWEAAVRDVKALSHNALSDRLSQPVEFGGIKALLNNLNQCEATAPIFNYHSDFKSDLNASDEVIWVRETNLRESSAIKLSEAHRSPRIDASRSTLQATRTFSSGRTPATLDASPLSRQAFLSESPQKMQSPQTRNLGRAEAVNGIDAGSPFQHRGSDFQPMTTGHFISNQQLRTSPSPANFSIGLSESQSTGHVVDYLQSLADDATHFSASILDAQHRKKKLAPNRPPAPTEGTAVAPLPTVLLQYEDNFEFVQNVGGRAHTPAAASPAPGRSVVSPINRHSAAEVVKAGGVSGQLSANSATAEVAARINSALAGFLNFQR